MINGKLLIRRNEESGNRASAGRQLLMNSHEEFSRENMQDQNDRITHSKERCT